MASLQDRLTRLARCSCAMWLCHPRRPSFTGPRAAFQDPGYKSARRHQSAGQVVRYLRRPKRVVQRRATSVKGRGASSGGGDTSLRQTTVIQ
jgi:hypothetical protein